MAQPIDIYFWPTPNGNKVSIFCEEAGLDYNLFPINISEGDQFKDEFLAISPNNKMPAMMAVSRRSTSRSTPGHARSPRRWTSSGARSRWGCSCRGGSFA